MKITILHNAATDADSAAERDVLAQVAAVEHSLQSLGHQTSRLACTLNLEAAEEALTTDRPQLVFNLVESLGGSDRLAHLAGVLLDDLDLPYTGTSADVFHLTNNKPRTKQSLRAANLPTPNWAVAEGCEQQLAPPYIIKAIWENASVGLNDHAVILSGDGTMVCDQIASRSRQLGYACFAEQFIDGREFNVSLIATPEGPHVLPPAEIDFGHFPAGRPKIVGYAAKRGDGAVDYARAPRIFEFPEADGPLLASLRTLALECWRLFGMAGYASVDFRVDERGQPWILEINANPCLAPDIGFAAALAKADILLQRAVEWVIEDALRPREQESGVRSQESDVGWDQRRASTRSVGRIAPAHHDSHPSPPASVKLRDKPKRTDVETVRIIVAASGLFREAEIDLAVELVQARLKKGVAAGHEFVFADENNQVVGYICFGKNRLTVSSFEIHWIAVEPSQQRRGIGQMLLEEAERQIAVAGGTGIYINTSQRADFQAARAFYERNGYAIVAVLDDFFAAGDSKVTYFKRIGKPTQPSA